MSGVLPPDATVNQACTCGNPLYMLGPGWDACQYHRALADDLAEPDYKAGYYAETHRDGFERESWSDTGTSTVRGGFARRFGLAGRVKA